MLRDALATSNSSRNPQKIMAPQFPLVIGRTAIDRSWSIDLPYVFRRRTEDKELVFWCRGFTIWASSWSNNGDLTNETRLEYFRSKASKSRFDEVIERVDDKIFFAYRVREEMEDDREPAFQGLAFAEHGHLALSIYFDAAEQSRVAWEVLRSASSAPPALSDPRVLSLQAYVSKRITQDRHHVGYMYRETPDAADDSGWRFFAGDETDEYANNPENVELLSVAAIVRLDRKILPYLEETTGAWGRQGDEFKAE